jgi:hypothetical protein
VELVTDREEVAVQLGESALLGADLGLGTGKMRVGRVFLGFFRV